MTISQIGMQVAATTCKAGFKLARAALEHPKITAVALGALAMNERTFGADGLIISLPCYVACLAAGAAAPICIAFCAVLP